MIKITRAIDIIYKITVTDVKELLDSNQINQGTCKNVKEALKRNTKYTRFVGSEVTHFVGLIKLLYREAIKLSAKKVPQEIEELEQTVDDIVYFPHFFKEVKVEDIRWAVNVLRLGKWMTKTIQ